VLALDDGGRFYLFLVAFTSTLTLFSFHTDICSGCFLIDVHEAARAKSTLAMAHVLPGSLLSELEHEGIGARLQSYYVW
jgi:hypothetical protein